MKISKLHLILFLLLFSCSLQAASIADALAKNKVEVKILENPESTHYHTPLILEITNITNTSLSLDLNNGTVLEANKAEFQNFIVTKHLLVKLNPNETKKTLIYAMCIEQFDLAPNNDVMYTFGGEASNKMKQLSLFLEKNEQFDPNAQFLMWQLAEFDYADFENIDFEIDEYGSIYMVKVNGDKKEKIIEKEIEDFSKPQLIVSGNFTMNLASNKNVHIAMFNLNNVLVKELYNNPNIQGGITKLEYEFNSYDFEDDEYYMKVVLDGKIVLERTIDMTY